MLHLLNRVFASFDAIDSPFQQNIESRILLFPTSGFMLNERQFMGLAQAATAQGDDEGICVITEGVDRNAPPDTFDTFKFPFTSYQAYRRLEFEGPVLMENVLISPNGTWGLLFSQEHHALVGGSAAFCGRFRTAYPDVDRELEAFVDAWKRQADQYDISWLPALLQHIGH